ncbi:hypothetical protein C5Y96_19610 [Blastopirellula marina]|uniref:Uncharacterized protein n=1 Tax=Blastopirellula marina TaxID=124 RepID=A0A2S8F424_9BACT|nr:MULTISPECIES: hypothetical protein [Pirellulaceae]PQO26694.1 hypothetical protein C5Y96_19610 [Blastopirellula marina]RCS46173.1 hypothetical protein DTL36_19640 [Bremerella cremea]
MFSKLTHAAVIRFPIPLLFFLLLPTACLGQQENSAEGTHIQITPAPSALTEAERIAKIEVQLRTSRATLDAKNLPLVEVAKILSAQIEIPIRLHRSGLEDVGLAPDTPVTFRLPDVPTETLLRMMLRELDLTYDIEADGIVFTTWDEAEENVRARFYNIEEIIPGPNRDYDAIIELISTTVDPESWDVGSGPSSTVPYQNGVILCQTLTVHQKIEALLAALREAKKLPAQGYPAQALFASPTGFASAAVHDRMRQVKLDVEIKEQPLHDVVKMLEHQSSTPFLIDRRALDNVGLSPETLIDLSLGETSLHHALDVLAEQYEMAWYAVGEVVVITSSEEEETELEVRVYPTRDLTWNGLNPADPQVKTLIDATSRISPRSYGGGFGYYPQWHSDSLHAWEIPELPSDPEYLIEAIAIHVQPNSWEESGGPGAIAYFQESDCLVILQTQQVHQKVAGLLQTIRSQQKPLDLKDLAAKIQKADEADFIMFYTVPRDREGKPKLSKDDLTTIAGRIQTLFGKGTWDQDTHFIDVTQDGLIVRHRRDVQLQISRFWSHLGPDESKLQPWPNHPGTGNQPPLPQSQQSPGPVQQPGGVF